MQETSASVCLETMMGLSPSECCEVCDGAPGDGGGDSEGQPGSVSLYYDR